MAPPNELQTRSNEPVLPDVSVHECTMAKEIAGYLRVPDITRNYVEAPRMGLDRLAERQVESRKRDQHHTGYEADLHGK
jgi:hypothetical protein